MRLRRPDIAARPSGLGKDGDKATAAAMKAMRDEVQVLRSDKAAKKAAFDAEYDVGGKSFTPALAISTLASPIAQPSQRSIALLRCHLLSMPSYNRAGPQGKGSVGCESCKEGSI